MFEKKPQTLTNHTRVVPPFHYGVLGILLINLLYSFYRLWRVPGADSVMGLLLALALLGLAFFARSFAITVQDRVIRLEMRLRLQQLLQADLLARSRQLSDRQLVALRFASDEELPGLVREVLDGGLQDGREIKKRVRNWQADYLRA